MRDQFIVLFDSLRNTWEQTLAFLPRLTVGLLFLLAGWVLARLVRSGMIRLLRLLRVDQAFERAGVEDFLLRGGVRATGVTLVGQTLYFVFLLAVVLGALDAMGLAVAATLVERVFSYLPNVIVAVVVLIFGSILARFVQGLVFTALNNLGVGGAPAISSAAKYGLLFFVVSLALDQLSIGGQLIQSAFQLAFGGVCLALALAFGLGGRDWAAAILTRNARPGRQGF